MHPSLKKEIKEVGCVLNENVSTWGKIETKCKGYEVITLGSACKQT